MQSNIQGLDDAELLAALRLARSAEIGPITFRNLIERFGSAQRAIEELPALAQRSGRASQIRLCRAEDAERELAFAHKLGAHFVVHGTAAYPALLAASEGAPSVLAIRGAYTSFESSAVAIVGARNASANGRKFAEALASGLGARGHVVVSGLARGIDTAAHRGALASGTVAVLAGGVDQIYPEENTDLYAAICETGCIVSEMPLGHVARAQDFPRRNRIIAGLTLGTVVVEAAERSGSLITARLAAELGREVFAVPGSPLDARCRGTNQLLKDGATLIETVEDVLANLPTHPVAPGPTLRARRSFDLGESIPRPAPRPVSKVELPPLPARLLELLGPSPVAIDELVRQSSASASEVQSALFDLELEGLILRHPGQSVSLADGAARL